MSDTTRGSLSFDADVLARHNLTADEYERIERLLGRTPNLTELGMFSVMWSEHCSYKSSRVHLRTLPTTGPRVVQGPGENAGAVDIGDELAAVFKIESHNHPSFIEPYQGAATGVGGIIRDIFTMGARPIALMNSLRFGTLDSARTRHLVEGVVAGIGGYGNSIGIPTVGGEVAFAPCYAGNPLVNALCLGIAPRDGLVRARAEGVGNPVFYVGAKTGRDGIHGATMASAEFDERSQEKRPAVQVGDPFMEKLLMEACLEALETDALVGLQDMGAAGLTCATSEMGARAGSGIEIDVTLVPQRESGMTPYEVMLSESQERMLLVAERGREADIQAIFEKWDLHAVPIGRVTDDGLLRVRQDGVVVAEVPTKALVDEAPVYDRPTAEPAYLATTRTWRPSSVTTSTPPADALLTLLASPTVASKRWVYRQYDHMVRGNSILLAGLGAAVVRIKGTTRALALSVDGNGRYVYLDPRDGAIQAVAEAARNVACAGAVPIGATNCLNFGNPERPEIMWQFAEAVAGVGEACRHLGIPVTGGNVSLYNETDGSAIYPTPILGIVGVIDDAAHVLGRRFPRPGLAVVVLGEQRGELGGSEWLSALHGVVAGRPPAPRLDEELALHQLLPDAARRGIVLSAHDVSDGGLAVTLAECCFDSGAGGVDVDLSTSALASDAHPVEGVLFGESTPQVVVSVEPSRVDEMIASARAAGVPAAVVGRTGGTHLTMRVDGRTVVDLEAARAEGAWKEGLESRFASRV
ncbi:MAG: phosphoribosylformylglycinamidine synthase subunit PurL [Vicinamibacterales bacterium]